jgi:predicted ATPase
VAQVLAVLSREVIPEGRRTPSPEGETTLGDLLHQTEWWTRRIIRPIELQAEWFPNSMFTRLRFKTPGLRSEWSRPPNMGFGVSYGLPVIVAGLLAHAGGFLIVENPEAHLHPAGQSAMGSFLAQVAADGVQVIVETHSDHVLNGIRHAVASPNHPVAAKDTEILFFLPEGDPDGPLKILNISESGVVSGWPEGFFDQFDIDLRAISELQRNRKRRT